MTLAHSEVARQLIELESFVTLCYARFDLEIVGRFRRLRPHDDDSFPGADRDVRHAAGREPALGVREGEISRQIRVALDPQDVLLFYSDGLTETRNGAGELFGIERLAECVRIHGRLEPEELVDRIRQAAVAFSNSETFGDDLTCVAVRIEERSRRFRAEIEISSDSRSWGGARLCS